MTQRRVVLITLGVMMSMFMASMESTVIATAMPTIVAQLGGLEIYSWVFAIYMLTSTTAGPIFGKLSDIYGRRPIYMAAIILFSIGSFLCGIAGTMGQLIAARAVQGLGAGGLLPLAFIIVGDIFSLEQRAKVQGLFSGVWGVSSVLGPLIGGFLVDTIGWHWVFLVNLPPAAIAAALVWTSWRDEAQTNAKRPAIDYAGAALLSTGVILLLLGLNELDQPRGWGILGLAIATLSLLVWVERRAASPILPLHLFRDRMFAVACIHGVLAGFVLFGGMSYIPLFVQGSYGTTATEAGTTLTPMLMGWVITSVIASRLLLRYSYRSIAIVGMSMFVVGALLLAFLAVSAGRPVLMVALALMGSGMGASIPAFLIAVQSSVTRNDLGSATSSVQFSRQIGGTLGVALLGVVLSTRLAAHLRDLGVDPTVINLDSLLGEGATTGTAALGESLRAALTSAMLETFMVTLVFAILALVVTFFAPGGSIVQMRDKRDDQESALAKPAPAGD